MRTDDIEGAKPRSHIPIINKIQHPITQINNQQHRNSQMAPGIITGPEGVILGSRKSNDNVFT